MSDNANVFKRTAQLQKLPIVAKTVAYTVLPTDSGTIFTNEGATAGVTFTLPAPAKGLHFKFLGVADFAITVTAATADTLIVKNDIAADSLAASTAGEIIGAVIDVVANAAGTKFIAFGSAVGHTYTIATA